MPPDPVLGIMRQFSKETFAAIARGNHLSAADLSQLVDRIAADPHDRISRFAVLGAHIASPQLRGQQVIWFIENEPFTSLGMYTLDFGEASRGSATQLESATQAWRRALARWDGELRVLEDGIWFFASLAHEHAADLLDSMLERLPHNPDAWELAAVVFDFISAADAKSSKDWSDRCVEAAFQAFSNDPEPERRLHLLPLMRVAASRAARLEVLEMLDRASAAYRGTQGLPRGPRRHGQLVALGFVALAHGEDDRALEQLADALDTSTVSASVRLLAGALAERGRAAEVREMLISAARSRATDLDAPTAQLAGL